MQVNPYLHYNGNCEAAFKFYEKAAGGKIEVMMTHESAPPDMPMPPDWKKKILHARITFDGDILMGSDSPPDHFRQPQGFSVTLTVDDPTEAEKKFKALSEGGAVNMPFAADLLRQGIRHVRRPVRHSVDGDFPDGDVLISCPGRDASCRLSP